MGLIANQYTQRKFLSNRLKNSGAAGADETLCCFVPVKGKRVVMIDDLLYVDKFAVSFSFKEALKFM